MEVWSRPILIHPSRTPAVPMILRCCIDCCAKQLRVVLYYGEDDDNDDVGGDGTHVRDCLRNVDNKDNVEYMSADDQK